MSAISFEPACEGSPASTVTRTSAKRWRFIGAFAVGFPVAFHLALLAVLVAQYGHLPNYVTRYDWIANVLRIIAGTQSVADMVPIILNEWVLEIGYMDYQYGHGIADWSLSIVPHQLAVISLTGALLGLNVALLSERRSRETPTQQCLLACRSGVLTSFGALSAGLTNATVFSVACCAAPSWVGSLAVLGLETSLVFTIEPFGPIASVAGIAVLAISAMLLARDSRSAQRRVQLQPPHGQRPC